MLGQHLVNLKCMIPSYTDADVFYGIGVAWAVAPVLLLSVCVGIWLFVGSKACPCFKVSDLSVKIKVSCVALLYLLWPSLCSRTFSLFACRSVCDDGSTYLRADLEEECGVGRHLYFALFVGLPMLLAYVVGLPALAYLRLHGLNQKLQKRPKKLSGHEGLQVFDQDHKVYGMLYSAYRRDTWW